MSALSRCRRRAQGWREEDVAHEKEDLRSLSAPLSTFAGSSFVDCEMGLSDLTGAVVTRSVFRNSRLPLTRFNAATLDAVQFIGCDLEQASFAGAVLRGVSFVDCRVAYSTFVGATFRNVAFLNSNLHGADLDVIESVGASFLGSSLWGVKVAFGCAFWNSKFDERTVNYFAALVARIHPNPESQGTIARLAGRSYRVVERLMRQRKEVA